jgi:hypothetical protein
VATRHGGIASWEAKVHPLKLRSTMMAQDHTLGPADGSYKVAVYKMEVSWYEGFLWFGKHQTAEIQVSPECPPHQYSWQGILNSVVNNDRCPVVMSMVLPMIPKINDMQISTIK